MFLNIQSTGYGTNTSTNFGRLMSSDYETNRSEEVTKRIERIYEKFENSQYRSMLIDAQSLTLIDELKKFLQRKPNNEHKSLLHAIKQLTKFQSEVWKLCEINQADWIEEFKEAIEFGKKEYEPLWNETFENVEWCNIYQEFAENYSQLEDLSIEFEKYLSESDQQVQMLERICTRAKQLNCLHFRNLVKTKWESILQLEQNEIQFLHEDDSQFEIRYQLIVCYREYNDYKQKFIEQNQELQELLHYKKYFLKQKIQHVKTDTMVGTIIIIQQLLKKLEQEDEQNIQLTEGNVDEQQTKDNDETKIQQAEMNDVFLNLNYAETQTQRHTKNIFELFKIKDELARIPDAFTQQDQADIENIDNTIRWYESKIQDVKFLIDKVYKNYEIIKEVLTSHNQLNNAKNIKHSKLPPTTHTHLISSNNNNSNQRARKPLSFVDKTTATERFLNNHAPEIKSFNNDLLCCAKWCGLGTACRFQRACRFRRAYDPFHCCVEWECANFWSICIICYLLSNIIFAIIILTQDYKENCTYVTNAIIAFQIQSLFMYCMAYKVITKAFINECGCRMIDTQNVNLRVSIEKESLSGAEKTANVVDLVVGNTKDPAIGVMESPVDGIFEKCSCSHFIASHWSQLVAIERMAHDAMKMSKQIEKNANRYCKYWPHCYCIHSCCLIPLNCCGCVCSCMESDMISRFMNCYHKKWTLFCQKRYHKKCNCMLRTYQCLYNNCSCTNYCCSNQYCNCHRIEYATFYCQFIWVGIWIVPVFILGIMPEFWISHIKNARYGRYQVFISNFLDIFRYSSLTLCVTLINCYYMTFEHQIMKFRNLHKIALSTSPNNHLKLTDNEFDNLLIDLDHVLKPYKKFTQVLAPWIVICFCINAVIYILLVISVVLAMFNKDCKLGIFGNTGQKAHFLAEWVCFMMLWIFLIFPLATNHAILESCIQDIGATQSYSEKYAERQKSLKLFTKQSAFGIFGMVLTFRVFYEIFCVFFVSIGASIYLHFQDF